MGLSDKRVTAKLRHIWIHRWTRCDKNLGKLIRKFIREIEGYKLSDETVEQTEEIKAFREEAEAFENVNMINLQL